MMKRCTIYLLMTLLCAVSSYAQSRPKRSNSSKNTRVLNNIRKVDFGKVGKNIPSRGGGFHGVAQIVYGDLTGDGEEEAVVVTYSNDGGNATYNSGAIYTLQNGRVKKLMLRERDGSGPFDHIPGGDRSMNSIHNVRVDNGLLLVERYASASPPPSFGDIDFIDTTTYRWNGSIFAPVGSVDRRRAQ